jgi:hypothetical protein
VGGRGGGGGQKNQGGECIQSRLLRTMTFYESPDAWFTVPQIELKYKVTAHGNRLINLKTVFYERMCSRRVKKVR